MITKVCIGRSSLVYGHFSLCYMAPTCVMYRYRMLDTWTRVWGQKVRYLEVECT